MTPETILVGVLTFLGGGSVVALITALFTRRKVSAEADVTVGEAWARFVQTQATENADLRRDNNELKGELRAAQQSIAQLERREREHAFWQAQVVTRDESIRARLAETGTSVPPMPSPPAVREVNTRADDPNPRGRTT